MSEVKKELLELIKRNGTLSVDEAVEKTGLAKTTLREHFLHIEKDGAIQRGYVRSGPGRPSLQYKLTGHGHDQFPSYESKMMGELLTFLKKTGQEVLMEEFFEQFWEKRFQKAKHLMDEAGQGKEDSIDVLMDMLREEGFMPEYKGINEDGMVCLKECNCPFREVVKVTTLPCRLEAEFFQKLFNTNVERTTYIAEGDHACTYVIGA
ncbi:MAG: DeoR family transcriptional regulator [Balneolaceae bacterium]|nr:MAG: DeoR family transcriptional regulator [Balneolaceae bacterium]